MRTGRLPALIGAIGLATAIAAGSLPAALAASESPAPSASAGTTAQAQTYVTLIVKGCEGCTIGVERGITDEPRSTVTPRKPDHWQGPTSKVKSGVAAIIMPTAYTAGASFTVSAPWEGDTDGMTNIVLGGGFPTGKAITVPQATHRKQGTACWAGTSEMRTSIHVRVIRRKLDGIGNRKVVFPIAWASPTVATVGPLSPTLGKGLLGNQDMYFC